MAKNVARVRVDLKMFGKAALDWDRDKAFRIMMSEFDNRRSDEDLKNDFKRCQFFESKSRKKRKKLKDTINRRQQDELEQRIRNGEKVTGVSGKVLKKIRADDAKKKKKKKKYD